MDPRIEALVAEQRLEAAAELAARLGSLGEASALWEQACQFERAAQLALEAGEPARSLLLAARVGADEIVDAAIGELASTTERVQGVADRLQAMGRPAVSARLLLASGDARSAAGDYETAGYLLEAADAYRVAGEPRHAARCLEALLRNEPDHHAARIRLADLLLQHRRPEPALRALQVIPQTAPERFAALPLLRRALTDLDLLDAARDIEREMQTLGIDAAAIETGSSGSTGQVLFGRYDVEREAARTPTALVLQARDRISGELVAIKLFSSQAIRGVGRDALRRFEQEAQVLGELQHRAIVPLRAFYAEGPALVLPWMSGDSLADRLQAGPVAPAHAAEIVVSVLDALEQAHLRGFLHRDVKPANVLFDAAGAAYLADFGTAHVSDASATVTAGVIGTLAYMAPEQRAGAPANVASDVYGAGALFWHALTGAPPGVTDRFLAHEITAPQAGIARQLIEPEATRPRDAASARALIESVVWPRQVPLPGSPAPTSPGAHVPTKTGRLQPLDRTLHRDQLLGRAVHVLAADPETLRRASSFARANHPRLAAVLCRRPAAGTLWIEALDDWEGPLDADNRSALRAALTALHQAGGHHGQLDAEHLARRGRCAMLRFPLAPPPGSAEQDLAALDRLVVWLETDREP